MTRNQRILAFIVAYHKQHGYTPMKAEIARAFQVTEGSLSKPLRLLEKMNVIQRVPGKQRNIRLVERQAA
jgi:SOS-response transcriptional repressor LexA